MLLKFTYRVFNIILLVCVSLLIYSQDIKTNNDTLSIISNDTIFIIDDTLSVDMDTIPEKSILSPNAVDAKIDYNADDSIIFSLDEKKVYLYGNAIIIHTNMELKADYIVLDLEKDIVFACGVTDSLGKETGKPEFKEGNEAFVAETMRYNFKTKKGIIKGVITEQGEGYLHSSRTKKMPNNEIHLKNGKYTTCDHEHPHFYVALTKAKVIPDEKIISGPAFLVIEDVPLPFIGIPFGFFPNKKGRASGILIPNYGEEVNRGFYLRDGGYYWGISDHFDLVARGEIYSKGSYGLKTQSRYKKRYKYNGNLSFDYYRNKIGDKGSTDFIDQKDYKLRWTHSQDPKARPNSSFSANVNFGSVTYDKYNSTNTQDYLNNTIQSSIAYSKTFANTPFHMSTNVTHSQNSRDSIVHMSLPIMTFNMKRIYPLKKAVDKWDIGWLENLGIGYTSKFQNTVEVIDTLLFEPSTLDKFKNGVNHSIPIKTSFNLLKYFNVSPNFSYTERWYFESVNKYWDNALYIPEGDTVYQQGRIVTDTIKGFNRVYDYSMGASLSTTMYGFYKFSDSFIGFIRNSGLQTIRHKIDPSIGFSYRPDFSEEKWHYYDTVINENTGEKIGYSPYQLGIYPLPGTKKSGMINFSLRNNIEAKVLNRKDSTESFKKIKILESLNLSSSYNLIADSLNLSNIKISARTNLFKMLNVNYDAILDPYVYDSVNNTRINTFEWEKNHKIGRITSWYISMGITLKESTFKKEDSKKDDMESEDEETDYYDYFKVPWSMRVNYSIRYSRPGLDEPVITQTLNFSGDLSLTPKWKIGISSGYDLENREFTFTNVNLSRDLHCWVMTFRFVPFGDRQNYNFEIGVKASILQDLKYTKREDWRDNF
ncbi:MAG: LPS-assembly protein LptD [Bacteroidales bacterium]|nr:LPS-assembly protein LptD [Bacteroidales bacterium]